MDKAITTIMNRENRQRVQVATVDSTNGEIGERQDERLFVIPRPVQVHHIDESRNRTRRYIRRFRPHNFPRVVQDNRVSSSGTLALTWDDVPSSRRRVQNNGVVQDETVDSTIDDTTGELREDLRHAWLASDNEATSGSDEELNRNYHGQWRELRILNALRRHQRS